jgi:hypothetical protein
MGGLPALSETIRRVIEIRSVEECMDWSGILGIAIALGIVSLACWGTQSLMDFLERLLLSDMKHKTIRTNPDHE